MSRKFLRNGAVMSGVTGAIRKAFSTTAPARAGLVAAFALPALLLGTHAPAAPQVWTLQNPAVPDAVSPTLVGVSCPSANACIAVGSGISLPSGDPVALAESWNGTAWTIESTPSAAGSSLASVSCQSPTDCTAVGATSQDGSTQPLAESWNGTAWTMARTPSLGGATAGALSGVSCTSATRCVAVGYARQGEGTIPLSDTWNGTTWRPLAAPLPAGSADGSFSRVSCTSRDACVAVGSVDEQGGGYVPLAESWDGTNWSLQSTPLPTGSYTGNFGAVSCSSASLCTAVGFYYIAASGSPAETLAEVWNGTSWSQEHTPALAHSGFYGISCSRSARCTAVGYQDQGKLALAEQWNGTKWNVDHGVVSPPRHVNAMTFDDVSCPTAAVCEAVGGYDGYEMAANKVDRGEFPLAEQRT